MAKYKCRYCKAPYKKYGLIGSSLIGSEHDHPFCSRECRRRYVNTPQAAADKAADKRAQLIGGIVGGIVLLAIIAVGLASEMGWIEIETEEQEQGEQGRAHEADDWGADSPQTPSIDKVLSRLRAYRFTAGGVTYHYTEVEQSGDAVSITYKKGIGSSWSRGSGDFNLSNIRSVSVRDAGDHSLVEIEWPESPGSLRSFQLPVATDEIAEEIKLAISAAGK